MAESKKISLHRHPIAFASTLKGRRAEQRRILGIDLGTNCGYAWTDFTPGQPLEKAVMWAGQWDLSLNTYDSGPLRFLRLKHFLTVLQPDAIGFEDVKWTPPAEMRGQPVMQIAARISTAAELLGAFKVMLVTWAEEEGIPAEGFGISAIKKFATGKGNANKKDMIKAANKRHRLKFDPETYEQTGVDNIVDAMYACELMMNQYAEAFNTPPVGGDDDATPAA
jgi:hypothetical protein